MTKYINKDGVEFNVGDKVVVVSIGPSVRDPDGMGPGNPYSNVWIASMNDSIGNTYTIRTISASGVYFEERSMGFPLTSLQKVIPFGVDNLKANQRVTTRDGRKAVVFFVPDGRAAIAYIGSGNKSTGYDIALFDVEHDEAIVEVHESAGYGSTFNFDALGELVYQNDEVKTAKEREAKLAAAKAEEQTTREEYVEALKRYNDAAEALQALEM